MKRIIPFLCFAVLLSGCANSNEADNDESFFIEGRFLNSLAETPLLITAGNGPCIMNSDSEDMFADFTDGDLIEIEFDGSIAETYPGQIDSIYSARLIENGEITDIDPDVIEDLQKMGWISDSQEICP